MKRFFSSLAICLSLFVFAGCMQSGQTAGNRLAPQDSAIISSWKKLFKNKTPDMLAVRDVRIEDHDWVEKVCIKNYVDLFNGGADMIVKNKDRTDDVTYQLTPLYEWLTYLQTHTNCDNIKVRYGIYPDPAVSKPVGIPPADMARIRKDRLTIFLWPFAGTKKAVITTVTAASTRATGDEADPYDLGEIHP